MKRLIGFSIVCASLIVLGHADSASAQTFSPGRSMRANTQNYINNRPTVSPYLNLTTRDANAGLPRYFTSVRPRVEQRQREAARQRQTAQMQRQLNQVATQQAQAQQQQQGMALTGRMGWSARGYPRHGIYLNYYPGMNMIRR